MNADTSANLLDTVRMVRDALDRLESAMRVGEPSRTMLQELAARIRHRTIALCAEVDDLPAEDSPDW